MRTDPTYREESPTNIDNTVGFKIGDMDEQESGSLNGNIAEVLVYNRGLSDNEVHNLHQYLHNNILANHRQFAGETDQPIAALLTDLKQRGMLDSTLVVCCGEFGRLPLVQKGGTGRDHNPHAFTTWLAGGGVKAGARHGATDEIGFKAVENRGRDPSAWPTSG